MEIKKEKLKGFFGADNMQRLFESREFVWIWAAIVLICWVTNGWIAGFIIAALTAGAILCLCRDTLPVLTILWTFVFMLGINRHALSGNLAVAFAVIPIIIGFIVNIVRFKPKFGFLSYKSIKVTTVAVLTFFAAVAVSGIAMHGRNLGAAFIVVAICVLFPLAYLFFSATISGGEDGKRAIKYLLFVIFVSGLIISLQLIIRYFQLGGITAVKETFSQKSMDIGWGGPNNYSIVLAMGIPATLYYGLKYGKYSPLFIVLAVVQILLVFLSRSRGSILFGGLVMIVVAGYAVVKCEYRGRMVATCVIVLMLGLFLFMYNGKVISGMLAEVLGMGLDNNGRTPLWDTAIELFKRQPIFGVGFDYNLGGMASDSYTPYWYHSTFYQALASTGIVGFLGWIYLELARLRVFFTELTSEKLFLTGCFAAFWLYALTDVMYFTPNGLIFLMVITLVMEKTLTEKQGRPLLTVKLEREIQKRALSRKEKKNESD